METPEPDILVAYRSACDMAGMLPDVPTLGALREGCPTLSACGDAAVVALLSLLSSGAAPHVTCLHFGGSALDSATITALASFLREGNKAVSELRLPKARLRDAGASALLAALLAAGKASPLRTLDIRSNKLKASTAYSLAAALGDPAAAGGIARLSYLDVSNNYIGHEAAVALESAAAARAKVDGPLELRVYGNLVLVEVLNGVTHGVGVLLALIAGSILVYRASSVLPAYQTLSMALYVISLCTMFLSSCLYHCFFRLPAAQKFWHTADHCSIFILIAGSYTPFLACYTMDPPTVAGPFVLAVVWISAIVGVLIAFKIIRATDRIRSGFALAMGWSGLTVIRTIHQRMSVYVLTFVVAGGLAYSGGIAFYLAGKKKPMMHVYWHLAVMLGGSLHMFGLWSLVSTRAVEQGLTMVM
jgi:hemolysin III